MPNAFGPKRPLLESRYRMQAGADAPGGLFREFSDWIHATTFRRLKIAAIVAICINLLLFFSYDLHGFRAGYAQSLPGFLALVYWRIAVISLSALFLAAANMLRTERG